MARLLSINVGLPRDVAWRGEKVHTAIWKQPVQGRVAVRRLNVEGDGQGDLAGHGGEHRAVMVYQMDAYRYWEAQLGSKDFSFGQFGENFTVDGLPDDEVCIGDRYRIGSALFEVTQPRVTCYRVGIGMAEPAMAALLVSHHRPGSTFACWRKATSAPATKSRKWRMAPNTSQWPTWMPSCICQTPRATNSKARCGCRRSARVGNRL